MYLSSTDQKTHQWLWELNILSQDIFKSFGGILMLIACPASVSHTITDSPWQKSCHLSKL